MSVVIPFTGAVEGATDEAALRRVVAHSQRELAVVYNTGGKANLLRRLRGFNAAAAHAPWLVLVDLNGETCAPEFVNACLPERARLMTVRVVVRALEAWVLADDERLARFLAVRRSAVPSHPEAIADPKTALVDVARQSRRAAIRADMVPRDGSGRRVGVGFEARLIEFLSDETDGWRPDVAAEKADSLKRLLNALA